MKQLIKTTASLALTLLASGALSACNRFQLANQLTQPAQPNRYVQQTSTQSKEIPGQVVVQFRSRPTQAFVQQFAAQNGLQALRVSSMGSVLFRQLNTRASLQNITQTLSRNPAVEFSHANLRYRRFFTVNDPRSAEQSGLAVIGASKAWDLTMGDPKVTIAVIDSGVDLQHPDLKANLVPGYNVINPGQPPQDDYGHGTHAAGIAAAVTDNRTGIAGACPRCRIMPIKALDNAGEGGIFEVAAGIVWAVDNGANIVNLSLGGDETKPMLERAIRYALSHNVVVVAAAGNGVPTQTENGQEMIGVDIPMYPAALPGVIAVGAVDTQRQRTRFSNFGRWVTIMAPGYGILSTMPTSATTMINEGFQQDYDVMDGTSMAAPMVAGVIGLMRSRHPQLTPDQVKTRLEGTAIDLGRPGFDTDMAHGMLDAFRAVL